MVSLNNCSSLHLSQTFPAVMGIGYIKGKKKKKGGIVKIPRLLLPNVEKNFALL